ncbi:hypothetical protein E2553_35125 [Paraburkholderia dipogonis]|uniref:Uncharacterized protein n=1 Tax=Paraburkholderia dipogonis TaxID=1211383 RepID=A0A4Y8MWW7_9BURK|nr:hypothetical protein [Paraburkholderia dipogonis]TFE41875.1 hypothetical protein E2553_35125 [Paraburkholderia dipogonis]
MSKTEHQPNSGTGLNSYSMPIYGAPLSYARAFAKLFEDAAEMPAQSPVVTTAVDPERFKASAVGGQSRLHIATVQGDNCYLLALSLQLGHSQFVWLADPVDPEFWSVIDEAKKAGRLGFAFLSPAEPWFQACGVPQSRSTFEQYRNQIGRGSDAFVRSALSMMKSGNAVHAVISVLPDVEIAYRRTCLLLTGGVTSAIASIPGAIVDRTAPLTV